MKKTLMIVVLVFGLAFALTAGAAADSINVGYVEWDCAISQTHIVAAVLEEHLGMDVNLISVDAGVMWLGISQGDLDVIVCAWLPNTHANFWNSYGEGLIDAGPNFSDAQVGLVVPQYVTADSIADLNDYSREFNSMIYGIEPGAGMMEATDQLIIDYGLNYTLLESSDAGMTMVLGRFYENEDWIVVTGWVPHWKFGVYDLKFLEDPKNIYGGSESIHTILREGFTDDFSSEVISFLENFYLEAEELAEMMNLVRLEPLGELELAKGWIADNDDLVQSWLQ